MRLLPEAVFLLKSHKSHDKQGNLQTDSLELPYTTASTLAAKELIWPAKGHATRPRWRISLPSAGVITGTGFGVINSKGFAACGAT